jgi:hypothetical protein
LSRWRAKRPGADTDDSIYTDIGYRLQSFILDNINGPAARKFNLVIYKPPVHNDLMATQSVQATYDRIAAQVAAIRAAGGSVIGTTEFGTFEDNTGGYGVMRADILAVNEMIRANHETLFDAFVDLGLLFPDEQWDPHPTDAQASQAAGFIVEAMEEFLPVA